MSYHRVIVTTHNGTEAPGRVREEDIPAGDGLVYVFFDDGSQGNVPHTKVTFVEDKDLRPEGMERK